MLIVHILIVLLLPLYPKLYGNLYENPSGVCETVHVGCCILCHILPTSISDVVLGMDWLHAINPWIDWHDYSPSLDYGGEIVCILGTKKVILMLILRFVH